LPLAIHYGWN
jgi:glucose-6-phosphate isomerase